MSTTSIQTDPDAIAPHRLPAESDRKLQGRAKCNHGEARLVGTAALALAAILGSQTASAVAFSSTEGIPSDVGNLRQMFTKGKAGGSLRVKYFSNHDTFFNDIPNKNTATMGGQLGFTTAVLDGFSLRISAFAQRNFARSSTHGRDLGEDLNALGEAYLQWQGYNSRIRAGNQEITGVPFTSTYDFRIIPQVYQGVSLRYGNNDNHVAMMRMFRYKSRIDSDYRKTTNYNKPFGDALPRDKTTSGFWAVGGVGEHNAGAVALRSLAKTT